MTCQNKSENIMGPRATQRRKKLSIVGLGGWISFFFLMLVSRTKDFFLISYFETTVFVETLKIPTVQYIGLHRGVNYHLVNRYKSKTWCKLSSS